MSSNFHSYSTTSQVIIAIFAVISHNLFRTLIVFSCLSVLFIVCKISNNQLLKSIFLLISTNTFSTLGYKICFKKQLKKEIYLLSLFWDSFWFGLISMFIQFLPNLVSFSVRRKFRTLFVLFSEKMTFSLFLVCFFGGGVHYVNSIGIYSLEFP